MALFYLAVALSASLCAAVVYFAARPLAVWFVPAQAQVCAASAAVLCGISVAIIVLRTPRPAYIAIPDQTHRAHAVSCARPLTPARGVAHGSLDALLSSNEAGSVASGGAIERDDILVFKGWGTDALSRNPLFAVCVTLDGASVPREFAWYGATRPDVAIAFKQPAVADSGYQVELLVSAVPPGEHDFAVVGVDESGREEPVAPAIHLLVR